MSKGARLGLGLWGFGFGFAALCANACGGIEPGDYVVYRVAFENESRSPNCYGGTPPPDEGQDTSTELTPDTWILYVGPDNKPYLDIGTTTLRGELRGDEYQFDGQRVDVSINDDGMGNTQTITTSTTTHVGIIVNGASIKGSYEQTQLVQCSGNGCPEPTDCTTTRALIGSEVEDVELQHEV
jgi:hypothetical protein